MKRYLALGLFVILVFVSTISCVRKNEKMLTADENNGGITLPDGFSALVVADNLGRGRHLAINDNGDIYVSLSQEKNNNGIAALRDTNTDGKADIIKYFGKYTGTGIKIHKGFLYFGSDYAIVRYKLNEKQLLPEENAEIIASGFVEERQHSAKPITFDNEGHMYVNVGAPSNACQNPDRTPGVPGTDPCPILEYAGGIWQFKDDSAGQDQKKDGHRYATGLRNCVAITWNTQDNMLYAVQHGRDQLFQFFPDLYSESESADLPAEEFFRLQEGDDCGWPYCYFDPIKNKKVLGPEYGGNKENTERCDEKKKPLIAFPAHTAPNDILFYKGNMFPEKYKHGAFIAFHGSWNRAPQEQKGYYVVFVPFANGNPNGKWEIFAYGFAGIEPLMSPGDAVFRPCGLAEGPDGSLYIADSQKGRIWRIFYNS